MQNYVKIVTSNEQIIVHTTLKKIKELGVGLEVASLPELYLAEATGFSADKIVFDSPSKTKTEIGKFLIST